MYGVGPVKTGSMLLCYYISRTKQFNLDLYSLKQRISESKELEFGTLF